MAQQYDVNLRLLGCLLLFLAAASFVSAQSMGSHRSGQRTTSRSRHRQVMKEETPEPTPFPTRMPTVSPTDFPTLAPTLTPTAKQMGGGDKNRPVFIAVPTNFPSPSGTIQWWTDKPANALVTTPTPTEEEVWTPLTNPPFTEAPMEEPTPSPTTAVPTTLDPTTEPPVTRAPQTLRPTSRPTKSPTKQPVVATNKPTVSSAPLSPSPVTSAPTGMPSSGPTAALSESPTVALTVTPTRAPIRNSVLVPALPVAPPTGAPVDAKTAVAAATIHTVTLLEFSILVLTEGTVVNLGQFERTLETYLLSNMKLDGLEMITLTLMEGDSSEGRDSVSTSVRFSGTASFNTTSAPLESDVHAEQGYVLKALSNLQITMDLNEALQGVSVADVSFERIDPVSVLDEEKSGSEKSSNNGYLGIVLGVFSASVVATACALLIIRHRRIAHRPTKVNKEEDPPPVSITEAQEETFIDTKPGCKSLCSADISLGDDDLSTYMMTASPRTYPKVVPPSPTPSSPKRPTEEISIRQDFEDDYDDQYLTNDETSVKI